MPDNRQARLDKYINRTFTLAELYYLIETCTGSLAESLEMSDNDVLLLDTIRDSLVAVHPQMTRDEMTELVSRIVTGTGEIRGGKYSSLRTVITILATMLSAVVTLSSDSYEGAVPEKRNRWMLEVERWARERLLPLVDEEEETCDGNCDECRLREEHLDSEEDDPDTRIAIVPGNKTMH